MRRLGSARGWLPMFGLLCLLVAAGRQPGSAQEPAQDAAIVTAVLRDLIAPIRAKYPNQPRLIGLSKTPLMRCTAVIGPCIVPVAVDLARREAAMGSWPADLAAAFDRQNGSKAELDLTGFDFPGVVTGERNELQKAHPSSLALAISWPIVVNRQSLVVVQFARTWSWLVLLSQGRDDWKVTKVIVVGVS